MTLQEWTKKQSNRSRSSYAHFDERASLTPKLLSYIQDKEKIVHHSFYPMIHYIHKSRYIKSGNVRNPNLKEREICYASHWDAWIYRYYSFLLNEKYNTWLSQNGLGSVALAYRTNLKGKSNIHFACDVFQFIRSRQAAYVVIGDFKDFFPTIHHAYLKQQWQALLQMPRLPADMYAIFKNITRYSYVELDDILAWYHQKESKINYYALNQKARILTKEEFRQLSRKSLFLEDGSPVKIKHKEPYQGIPQGSPISGVLANIYMMDIDQRINQLVSQVKGIYRRYSDDFIIVLPEADKSTVMDLWNHIKNILNQKDCNGQPLITLQDEKTQIYHVKVEQIQNQTREWLGRNDLPEKKIIEFLGFAFDGKCVTIRAKTIGRYYGRLYRKARTIIRQNGRTRKGNRISFHVLYKNYSRKGAARNNINQGNFITYVQRARRVFPPTDRIDQSTRNHMKKIHRLLRQIRRGSPQGDNIQY